MSGQVLVSPFFSYGNQQRKQEDDFDAKILKAVKKEMSVNSEFVTSAPPIVATTITLEAIQDALHSQGFSIESSGVESPTGPFEDTQFDQVVDVQTNSDGLVSEEDELNLMSISDIGIVSGSEREILEIDLLNYDSGIDEEFEEAKASSKSRKTKSKETILNEVQEDTSVESAEETEEDTVSRFNCQYLWEFLQNLLNCKRFNKYIEWKNHPKGVFKLIDHHSVARLWGIQKKRKNMTYDKLSRALRYYYSKDILRKVDGERLTYRFCKTVYNYSN